MGNNYIRDGIIRTICYADIFDYPLTSWEVWRFFIGDTPVSKEAIKKEVKSMQLVSSSGFYCFIDRKQIISKRINSDIYSKQKYKIATKICSILAHIPTVFLIGISGGLAMSNVAEDDDIDVFIIAKNNTLWITRLFVLLILAGMGVRRKKGVVAVSNKICLNMMVTEDGMVIHQKKQNLFTAHEVVQMKPLFVRKNTYERFLLANRWISKFLPNSREGITNYELRIMDGPKNPLFIILNSLFMFIEFIAKKLQLWYMRSHVTTEVVSDTILAFHPKDYTRSVLKKYQEKIKQYEKI